MTRPEENGRPRVFVTRRIFPEAEELISAAAEMEVWPEEGPAIAGDAAGEDGGG